jgi:N-methylhydantoinase B/oxoprolinase/acetone carboxylase alpha subunit
LSVLAQPGAGATFGTDGWGQPGAEALGLAPSVEEFETGSDFSIQRMEFATDTSGSGQWRGATGVVTDILLPQGTGDCIYALPLNHVAGPLGFGGGLPGAAGSIVLHSADIADEVIEARTVARDLSPFTSVTIHAPGGGGIGNPMDRKRESVMNDLRDGYISEHTARTVYGLATS